MHVLVHSWCMVSYFTSPVVRHCIACSYNAPGVLPPAFVHEEGEEERSRSPLGSFEGNGTWPYGVFGGRQQGQKAGVLA